MEDMEQILAERGDRYGSFAENARVTQEAMSSFMSGERAEELSLSCREMLHMVCHKLSRMTNGDYTYEDNLVDIIGYVQLQLNILRAKREIPQ